MSNSRKFEIKEIQARQILDSRGEPTVECEIITKGGEKGMASVPSGSSRGKNEALELRDNEEKFDGKSVNNAVENIEEKIGPNLNNEDCRNQERIDRMMIELDGTENKRNLGANAILAVSLAVAKAAAKTDSTLLFQYLSKNKPQTLPIPIMNLINGGAHAGNKLSIQEFWILPVGAENFPEAIRMGCEIYYMLEDILEERYGEEATNVGDEGGFAPPLTKAENALDILVDIIENSGFELNEDIFLGIDAAASNFYSREEKRYKLDGKKRTKGEVIEFYKNLVSKYPLIAIEDPLFEEDFNGFSNLTKQLGEECLIIGDDLFVTHPGRLRRGVQKKAANALILKLNQIGTLTETLEVANLAKNSNYARIVSHRSGETTDTFIADLVLAIESNLIKTGAPARGERVCKYNRLLRINEILETPQYPKSLV